MDNFSADPSRVQQQIPQPNIIQRYGPLAYQFLRFGVVGVLNTGIDFIILNVLSAIFQVTSGPLIIPLKFVAFLAANVNSYFINKKWTFKDNSGGEGAKKFSQYLAVSIIGALINIAVVYLITTKMEPSFGLSDKLWLNAANLVATGLSLIWNFIGYKLIVFKKKEI